MTHKLDRQLKGVSTKLNGYILDNADRDPTYEVKHHVYCTERRLVYLLTKKTYDETIKQIDQNRKNDRHRIEDAAFKIGDFIVFTFTKEKDKYFIVDFELAENPMDLLDRNGKNVFLSQVVFNKKLDRVITEHFGHFNVNSNEIRRLNVVPTPNVVLKCFMEWTMTPDLVMHPKIMEIEKLEPDDHDFAYKAEWNRNTSTSYGLEPDDDDVMVEEKEIDKISAIRDKKGFITGLTSAFIPDMPSKTVIFPLHNLTDHFVGRETINLDIVFNDIHKCYIILDHRPRISTHYHTLFKRTANDVQGIFYVDIETADNMHGFFKHKHLNLIADPYGFLDTLFHISRERKGKFKTVFKVPIRDRLGRVHDSRSISDLDVVTRFEVTGTGDDESQIQIVEELRKRNATINANGIVVNAQEGRVFGYKNIDKISEQVNWQGFNFILPPNHSFENGAHIRFSAKRIFDPDIMKPTFQIVDPSLNSVDAKLCKFENGWFIFPAVYDEHLECYEAYPFGYVPSKKAPDVLDHKKRAKLVGPREVIIRAKENRRMPGQTVFCRGEYVSD